MTRSNSLARPRFGSVTAAAGLLLGLTLTPHALTQDSTPAHVPDGHTTLSAAFAQWKLEAATSLDASTAKAKLATLQHRVNAALELEPDNGPLVELATDIEERRASSTPPQSAQEDAPARTRAAELIVAEAVNEAVHGGKRSLIVQLGARAIPALRISSLQVDGTPLPEGSLNPLLTLLNIDVQQGMDVALTLLASGDVLKKSFAATAVDEARVFLQQENWEPVGATDWKLVNPEWARFFDLALAEPALPPKIIFSSLQTAIGRGLVPDLELAQYPDRLLQTMHMGVMPESARAYFERLLTHADSGIRLKAIHSISGSEDLDAVYALAGDPNPDVRLQIATLMEGRIVTRWRSDQRLNGYDETFYRPELSSAYKQAFLTLALDTDPGVRRRALKGATRAVTDLGIPLLRREEFSSLLRRLEVPSQRFDLLQQLPIHAEADRLPLLLEAIELYAGSNRSDGDFAAEYFLTLQTYGLEAGDAYLSVLDALRAHRLIERKLGTKIYLDAERRIGRDALDANRYIEWVLAEGRQAATITVGHPITQTSAGVKTLNPWLAKASSSNRAEIFPLIEENYAYAPGAMRGGVLPIDLVHLKGLLDRDDVSSIVHEWAAHEIIAQHKDALDQALVRSLASAFHRAKSVEYLNRALDLLPGREQQSDLVIALAEDPATPMKLLTDLRIGDISVAAVEALLARFPVETWSKHPNAQGLSGAVFLLARATKDNPDPRLLSANIRESNLQNSLAYAIATERSEALFPLLGPILRSAKANSPAWKNAVTATSGYFNDDAAALLLETARATQANKGRQYVMDALNQMTEWRNAAAAWEKSRGAAARRDAAIVELLAILDDAAQPAAIRAEAVRGLGLLNAVEELPRLIRTLQSDEAPLAAAAREAIDRMNRESK